MEEFNGLEDCTQKEARACIQIGQCFKLYHEMLWNIISLND